MTTLWLVPVDEPSFQATVALPVDLSGRDDKPVDFPEYARVWAVRSGGDPESGRGNDGARGRWNDGAHGDGDRAERIPARGDPMLLYRNSKSRYVATGRIGPVWRTDHVPREYWGGGPPTDVFAIEGYTEVEVEPGTVNRVLDFEETFFPGTPTPVDDDRPVDRLLRRVDLTAG